MLPHVDPENGHLAPNDRILVLCGHNREAALPILHQPSPPAPLDSQKRRSELLPKRLEIAPRLRDCRHEGWRGVRLGVGRGAGRQVLPEERVVDVAAGVEADGGLQRNARGDVGCLRGGGLGLKSVVEVRYIGLVMLAVMELHDLG